MKTTWRISVAIGIWLMAALGARAADIKVDCGKPKQTIHGFGTCMKSWGSPDKCPVVRWQQDPASARLYAQELGCKMVRIPIAKWVLGGPNPYKIPSPDVEPLKADPEKISWKDFLWERSQGRSQDVPKCQIAWAQAMLKLNPKIKVFGSVWSPPHWMKEKAQSGAGKKFNWSKFGSSTCGGRLSPKYYEHYAKYLAEWSKGLKEKFGIDLYAVSVQNELLFYEPYDSCVYGYGDFAAVVRVIGKRFAKEGITTRIIGPEDMTKFPRRTARFLAPFKNDAELQKYLPVVCSHGYADGIETNLEASDVAKLWTIMQETAPAAEYWMTETGGGTGSWTDVETQWKKGKKKGQKRILKGALSGFGAMLHNALVYGHASVWTTWQFLDVSEGCAHGLVQATMEKMIPTKKFYVQKHYARYIPADARRVEAGPDGQDKILVSAYTEAASAALTIVLQNHADKEQAVNVTIQGGPTAAKLKAYVTDGERDCASLDDVKVVGGKAKVTLPARSIVTLTTVE